MENGGPEGRETLRGKTGWWQPPNGRSEGMVRVLLRGRFDRENVFSKSERFYRRFQRFRCNLREAMACKTMRFDS